SRPVETETARDDRGQDGQSQAASQSTSLLPNGSTELKALRFRLNLDPDVPYLRQRGLEAETIAHFGLGLCRRGCLKGYVAIPIYGFPQKLDTYPLAYLGRWPGSDHDD